MLYSDYVYERRLARAGTSIYKMTPKQLKRLRKKVNAAVRYDRFFR